MHVSFDVMLQINNLELDLSIKKFSFDLRVFVKNDITKYVYNKGNLLVPSTSL